MAFCCFRLAAIVQGIKKRAPNWKGKWVGSWGITLHRESYS